MNIQEIIKIILLLLLLLLSFLFFYNVRENFELEVINSRVRTDNTCSDPEQTNMLDKFDYMYMPDIETYPPSGCPDKFALCNYYSVNICLPICDTSKGWTTFASDTTYCKREDCANTADLSANIMDSWNNTCSVIYKQFSNLTSTIGSISSVTSTINSQYYSFSNNINTLSNSIYTTSITDTTKLNIRNLRFPQILANYQTLETIKNGVQNNFNLLNNKKSKFDIMYNSLSCSNYA